MNSIQASLPKGLDIAPGQKSPLVLTFSEPNGKILTTEGAGQGKVMWSDLKLSATVVAVNNKGVVSLPHDPRVSDGKIPHVTVTVPSHPDLRADLDIPIRYDEKYVANFSGSRGSDGMSGSDGSDGTSGIAGSMDPNNPSAGGDGGNGGDGSNGQDGSNGGDAPPVQVRMTVRADAHPLLQVSVSADGHQKFYLIDPQGGSLTVKANGGEGGSGGRGGRGGSGGSGGIGSPNGSDGRSGSDGRNGGDGSHGRGGLVTVTYDPQAKAYLNTLHLSSQYGPAPVFREETVAALW
ncbi:MAG: hypothetical protein WAM79_22240 [Candidatus Sulfotelmatobacter sp.]